MFSVIAYKCVYAVCVIKLRAKFKFAIRMMCLVVGLNSMLKNLQTKKGDAQSIEQVSPASNNGLS